MPIFLLRRYSIFWMGSIHKRKHSSSLSNSFWEKVKYCRLAHFTLTYICENTRKLGWKNVLGLKTFCETVIITIIAIIITIITNFCDFEHSQNFTKKFRLLSFWRRYSCIGMCGSEREWAQIGVGVSAKIDKRMTKTRIPSQINSSLQYFYR